MEQHTVLQLTPTPGPIVYASFFKNPIVFVQDNLRSLPYRGAPDFFRNLPGLYPRFLKIS